MHTRIVTTQLKPGTVDQAIQIWHDHVVPTLKAAKGFKRSYLSGDRNSGKSMAIAVSGTLNASGRVTCSVTPLITVEEIDEAVKLSPSYRAPGQ